MVHGGVDDQGGVTLQTTTRAFVNTVKAFIASGILGLPFAFSKAGIWLGLGLIPPLGWLSYHCMMQIVETRNILLVSTRKISSSDRDERISLVVRQDDARTDVQLNTFTDMMTVCFGRLGSVLANTAILSSQLGFCVVYLIFMSSNLHKLIPQVDARLWIAIILPLCYGLALLRSLKRLAPFTGISNVCIFLGLVVILSYAGPKMGEGSGVVAADWVSFPVFGAGLIYAFEGISVVVPVESTMVDRTKYPLVLRCTCALLVALFAVFGSIGYSAYGSSVDSVITLELPANGLTDSVLVALIIAIFGTYGLMMYPAVEIVEDFLFFSRMPGVSRFAAQATSLEWKRNGVRLLLVVLTAGVALAIPNFGLVISFIGSFTCVPLMFVFPPAMHMKALGSRKIGDVLVFAGGLLGMAAACSLSVLEAVG